jgi:hypothetical protein
MNQHIEGILIRVENGMAGATDARLLKTYIEELEMEAKCLHVENDRLVEILQTWEKEK